jgi:hypothetical protein
VSAHSDQMEHSPYLQKVRDVDVLLELVREHEAAGVRADCLRQDRSAAVELGVVAGGALQLPKAS